METLNTLLKKDLGNPYDIKNISLQWETGMGKFKRMKNFNM